MLNSQTKKDYWNSISDRYKEETDTKDSVISDLRGELVEKNAAFERDTSKLKEMVIYLFSLFWLQVQVW